MRDHGLFQYLSLSVNETEALKTAQQYHKLFEGINTKAKSETGETSGNFLSENINLVTSFIQFKKMMLRKLMTCEINLAMTPTFLQHMIDEALEFYRVLKFGEDHFRVDDVMENLRLHLVWLPDASGHAKYIAAQLDGIEAELLEIALNYQNTFDLLFKKAHSMHSLFDSTNLDNGALHQFNLEVENAMEDFISFLDTMKELKSECRIYTTGTFSELIPDHMMREERYYLSKVKDML
jgi:hypothetical protein